MPSRGGSRSTAPNLRPSRPSAEAMASASPAKNRTFLPPRSARARSSAGPCPSTAATEAARAATGPVKFPAPQKSSRTSSPSGRSIVRAASTRRALAPRFACWKTSGRLRARPAAGSPGTRSCRSTGSPTIVAGRPRRPSPAPSRTTPARAGKPVEEVLAAAPRPLPRVDAAQQRRPPPRVGGPLQRHLGRAAAGPATARARSSSRSRSSPGSRRWQVGAAPPRAIGAGRRPALPSPRSTWNLARDRYRSGSGDGTIGRSG